MTENSQLARAKQTDFKAIMRSDEIKAKFMEALGSRAVGSYIQACLITVAENEALQRCTPVSIIAAALRAATMRLSVDLTSGQAYLVPFRDKCTLVIGYRGLIHLALRTGKYLYLNDATIYEGEAVTEDRMTGLHTIGGHCTSKMPIGHLLYFQLNTGFKKSFYMSCEECEDHGRKYSKSFNLENSLWRREPELMHKKTVIRLGLTRWGYFEPADLEHLAGDESVIEDPGFVLPEVNPNPAPEPTSDESMLQLGFND